MTSGFEVSEAPDGNGGIFDALEVSGALNLLENHYHCNSVHVFSVDNALCKVADPLFFGFALKFNAQVANKVVWKRNSEEKVGVVARKAGKLAIVEYTELGAQQASALDEVNGKLLFGAGNICNHYFSVPFLRQVVSAYKTDCSVMPYHVAHKKVPFADAETGKTVHPDAPNGIKLEAYIFDCFGLASQSSILEVDRNDEFGPVKNAPGVGSSDSPDTARAMLMDIHMNWAKKSGASFLTIDESFAFAAREIGGHGAGFEISPLLSYGGENLDEKCQGKTFDISSTIFLLQEDKK